MVKWSATPWYRLKKETIGFTEIDMQYFAAYTGNSAVGVISYVIDRHK